MKTSPPNDSRIKDGFVSRPKLEHNVLSFPFKRNHVLDSEDFIEQMLGEGINKVSDEDRVDVWMDLYADVFSDEDELDCDLEDRNILLQNKLINIKKSFFELKYYINEINKRLGLECKA